MRWNSIQIMKKILTAKSDWIQSKIEIESETLAAKSDEFECDFSKILAVKYQNINFE